MSSVRIRSVRVSSNERFVLFCLAFAQNSKVLPCLPGDAPAVVLICSSEKHKKWEIGLRNRYVFCLPNFWVKISRWLEEHQQSPWRWE